MNLSKRMEAVASYLTKGYIMADIGTDHGYVPIYLVKNNIVPKAFALDLRKGPLDRAKEHIAEEGLADKITTRLSDGLEKLEVGEAESIVIAGMGGELVIHILSKGDEVAHSLKELILQPQSKIDEVRKYLRDHNFYITHENMVYEEGKYYPMMRIIPVENKPELEAVKSDLLLRKDDFKRLYKVAVEEVKASEGFDVNLLSLLEDKAEALSDLYGEALLLSGNQTVSDFLMNERKILEDILGSLLKAKSNGQLDKRIEELKLSLIQNDIAYKMIR